MKSPEYKTVFKNFAYFNLYDRNLSKDILDNPHEKLNKKNNNNINENNEKNNEIIEEIKSFN